MTELLLPVLAASLVGSAHCAAMCGAFACSAADVERPGGSRLRASAAYHGARLAGYLLLGGIAGAVGGGLDAALPWRTFGRPAALIAGVMLIAWGAARIAVAAGVPLPKFFRAGATPLVSRMLRGAAAGSPVARAAALGLVAPLLPCGWLYAFLAPAAASGSAPGGAAVMAVFWVGTLPALAAVAVGAQRALGPARRFLPVTSAIALIVVGSLSIIRATRDARPDLHSAHTLPHVDGRR